MSYLVLNFVHPDSNCRVSIYVFFLVEQKFNAVYGHGDARGILRVQIIRGDLQSRS